MRLMKIMSELHGFALWNKASEHFPMVRDYLDDNFEIMEIHKVTWPSENVSINFNRLYGRDLRSKESRHLQVGDGPFHYFIVKDKCPKYRYHKNVSGKVELINFNVITAKYFLRDKTADTFKYYIHSSNNAAEYNKDISLIFGEHFTAKNKKLKLINEINISMPGANGWGSINEALSFCSKIEKVVLLRGDTRNLENEDEIDILCKDPWFTAGLLNAKKITNDKHKYDFLIKLQNGRKIKLDLRCITDKYIPSVWASNIYNEAIASTPMHVIDYHNQYFLNLYHEFIHKIYLRKENIKSLLSIRNDIFLEPLTKEVEKELLSELRGFLIDKDYFVERPNDPDVNFNFRILPQLFPAVAIEAMNLRSRTKLKLKLLLIQSLKFILKIKVVQLMWQTIRKTWVGEKLREIRNEYL